MRDQEADRRVTEMLEELGPADPPSGFVRHVMDQISLEKRHEIRGRIVPFHRGGIVMTRKAMWGIAAAAAVALGVYTVTGFPPVDKGTEGTIGAAQKYQAPQLSDSDVVLGDAAAQEFLQSETFDRLLKDPEARALLSDRSLQRQLQSADFMRAIKSADVRNVLASDVLRNVLSNDVARAELIAQLSANLSADAVNQAALSATRSAEARAMVADLLSSDLVRQVFSMSVIRTALLDRDFLATLMNRDITAALNRDTFARSISANGFYASLMNGKLSASLSRN
jgi:hypothetical protein